MERINSFWMLTLTLLIGLHHCESALTKEIDEIQLLGNSVCTQLPVFEAFGVIVYKSAGSGDQVCAAQLFGHFSIGPISSR